jgi:tRNA-dihydrouridine synthase B
MEKRAFNIGEIRFENPLILAPMDGITDMPFRKICKKLGADLIYNEFIQAEIAHKDGHKFKRKLDFSDMERPIALQLYSGDVDSMVKSCIAIEKEYKPDFIDMNFGCWKSGICRRGAGAGALKNPDLMVEIIKECSDAVATPITAKTRLGWDEDSIIIEDVAPKLEEAGCKALGLHCRTRSQGMGGKADWKIFDKVKEKLTIPLFLNGDIFTPHDALRGFKDTKADGLMIGRAAMYDPFIFKYMKEFLETGRYRLAGAREKLDICIEHLDVSYQYRGFIGLREFRKHYKTYLKEFPIFEEARKKLVRMDDYDSVMKILNHLYTLI